MENLRVLENELVPVYVTSTGEKVVYGTELHEVLDIRSKFADWIKNRLNDCDADPSEDYDTFSKNLESGGRSIEYIIKLDMAKEMAMMEKNEKGKQVRRYFIRVDKKYQDIKQEINRIPLPEQIEAVAVAADILKVNEASKVYMIGQYFKSYDLPTDFLPDYVSNGNRQYKPVTELLKENAVNLSAQKFNTLLIQHGYLEDRERKSTSNKTGKKKFKALTDKGLQYGENLINPKNQKEVQPQYYVDTFGELCRQVIQ